MLTCCLLQLGSGEDPEAGAVFPIVEFMLRRYIIRPIALLRHLSTYFHTAECRLYLFYSDYTPYFGPVHRKDSKVGVLDYSGY